MKVEITITANNYEQAMKVLKEAWSYANDFEEDIQGGGINYSWYEDDFQLDIVWPAND